MKPFGSVGVQFQQCPARLISPIPILCTARLHHHNSGARRELPHSRWKIGMLVVHDEPENTSRLLLRYRSRQQSARSFPKGSFPCAPDYFCLVWLLKRCQTYPVRRCFKAVSVDVFVRSHIEMTRWRFTDRREAEG